MSATSTAESGTTVRNQNKVAYPAMLAAITTAQESGKSLRCVILSDPDATALTEVVERIVHRISLPAFVARGDMVQEGISGILSAIDNVDLSLDHYQVMRYLVSHAEYAIQDAQRRANPLTRSQAQAHKLATECILDYSAERAKSSGSGDLTEAERYQVVTRALPRADEATKRVAIYGPDSLHICRTEQHPSADTEFELRVTKRSLHLAVALACTDYPDCKTCQRAAMALATESTHQLDPAISYHSHLMLAASQDFLAKPRQAPALGENVKIGNCR